MASTVMVMVMVMMKHSKVGMDVDGKKNEWEDRTVPLGG